MLASHWSERRRIIKCRRSFPPFPPRSENWLGNGTADIAPVSKVRGYREHHFGHQAAPRRTEPCRSTQAPRTPEWPGLEHGRHFFAFRAFGLSLFPSVSNARSKL